MTGTHSQTQLMSCCTTVLTVGAAMCEDDKCCDFVEGFSFNPAFLPKKFLPGKRRILSSAVEELVHPSVCR